jgi:hypothetical protein
LREVFLSSIMVRLRVIGDLHGYSLFKQTGADPEAVSRRLAVPVNPIGAVQSSPQKVVRPMQFLDRVVPRITHVIHRIHALTGMAMLYWWELKHLYVYLFPAK